MKKVISILLTVALILSCISMTAFAADEAQEEIITAAFPDFTNQTRNSHLRLEGISDANPDRAGENVRAIIEDGKINLTAKNGIGALSTAFLDKKITTDNAKFSTYFTFEQHASTDGLCFAIGNSGTSCPARYIQNGMSRENNTMYVLFDTNKNTECGDISDNFIQVCSSKRGFGNWDRHVYKNLDEYVNEDKSRKMVIKDGQLKHCWIDYNGSDMYITLSNTENRDDGVDIEFNFGRNIIGDLLGSDLYFGFSAIVYNATPQLKVNSWYLDNSYSPIDLTKNTYNDDVASISMQAVTYDNQTATVSILAEDYLGQPADNIELSLTSTTGELSESTVTTDANGLASVTLTGEDLSGTVIKAVSDLGISATASVVLSDATPITAAFDDFSEETCNQALVLEGISDSEPGRAGENVRAIIEDGKINLTPVNGNAALSTAFLDKKVDTDNAAFSTYFTFEQQTINSDGLCFVIGNSGTSCHADMGQNGVSRENNTMYVLFDTNDNDREDPGDPSDNFIRVCSSIKNQADWNSYGIKDLNDYLEEDESRKMVIIDGQLKHCWIDYDGSNMYITLSNTGNRDDGVDIEFNFGSNIIGDLLGEELYFGFSAVIYGNNPQIKVSSWYLDNKYAPIDNTANYSFAPTSVNVAASAESINEADVQVTAYDYAGNLYSGAEVTLYSANNRFDPVTVTTGLNGKATATVSGDIVYMDTITAVANGGAKASTDVAYTQPDVTVEFEAKTFNSTVIENGTLNYRIYVPDEYDGTQSYPVLLFLHGQGERGTDNTIQITNNTGILKRLVGMESDLYKCIIVAPQCPSDDFWCKPANNENYNVETQETTNANAMAYELLQSVISEYNADTDRIYGAGLSMGCFGIMDMAMKHQRLFAAIAAVCGATDVNAAYRLYGTSIWFFHGDNDQSVIVYNSRDAYTAYSEAGLDVKYNEYKGVNHDSWNNAFAEAELLDWMFSKSLPELAKGDITGDGNVDIRDLVRLKTGTADSENAVIYGNADYNNSGVLDSGDLITERQILLGKNI